MLCAVFTSSIEFHNVFVADRQSQFENFGHRFDTSDKSVQLVALYNNNQLNYYTKVQFQFGPCIYILYICKFSFPLWKFVNHTHIDNIICMILHADNIYFIRISSHYITVMYQTKSFINTVRILKYKIFIIHKKNIRTISLNIFLNIIFSEMELNSQCPAA